MLTPYIMYSTVADVKENKLQPDDQLDRQNQPCSIWHSQAMHGADTGQEEQQEGEVHPEPPWVVHSASQGN